MALALSYETLLTQVRHHHKPEHAQLASLGEMEDPKPSEGGESLDDTDEEAALLQRARREIEQGQRDRIQVGRSRLAEALDITPVHARKLLEQIAEEARLRVVR